MKAGKVWGETRALLQNPVVEFHRIEVNAGGECSTHKHAHKWNGFFVESGSLLIRVWQKEYELCDETVLKAGDYTKVKPGLLHQFECLEDAVAYELYWAEFPEKDIKRDTVGFQK